MTYPLSTEVAPGQPTAASHYNTLRSDALRLGQSAADAATLGELLGRYQAHLTLELIDDNRRVRVPASPAQPAALVISGVPLVNTFPVDLPLSAAPAGAAGEFYIFALQSPGSRGFTLDLNTTTLESSGRRLIGAFYWNGSSIDAGSLRTLEADALRQSLSFESALVCEGRLTLESGKPVPVSEISAAAMLYFTPYHGNRLALYSPGRGWVMRAFSEVSLPLAELPPNKLADVFISDQPGGLMLTLAPWTNDTTRAQPLGWQDGCPVQAGMPERRYLGTLRSTAAGVSADNSRQRLLWNFASRLPRRLKVIESANSWTNTTAGFRPFNNSTLNRVELVSGIAELPVSLRFMAFGVHSAGQSLYVGIGLDSIMESSADLNMLSNSNTITPVEAAFNQVLSEGYHYLQLLETGASTITWYGDYNAGFFQSGAVGMTYA